MKNNNMIRLIVLLAAALGATVSHAAVLYVTSAPASMTVGQAVDWIVSVEPESGEQITGFSLNVGFSDWLTPGPVTELGYLAQHGVFFFEGLSLPDSITFISDVLSASDYLSAGQNPLIRISFTATQDGAPELFLFDPILTLSDSGDATVSSIVYTDPVVTGGVSDVPEPSTMFLFVVGGILLLRRRHQ